MNQRVSSFLSPPSLKPRPGCGLETVTQLLSALRTTWTDINKIHTRLKSSWRLKISKVTAGEKADPVCVGSSKPGWTSHDRFYLPNRPNNVMKRRPLRRGTINNYWACLVSCGSDADREGRQTQRRHIKASRWGRFTPVNDLSGQQWPCNIVWPFFHNLLEQIWQVEPERCKSRL